LQLTEKQQSATMERESKQQSRNANCKQGVAEKNEATEEGKDTE
jgi:hypothetical protein